MGLEKLPQAHDLDMEVRPVHVAVLGVFIFSLIKLVIYPAFFSPLAKIPAVHWSCHVLPFWLWWARLYGWENRRTCEAHRRKGPVLRIAPNQLSVNCYEEGLRKIYLGNFPRSDFYINGFLNYGKGHMFTMMSPAEHGARKKLFSNAFSKSNILASPSSYEISKVLLFDRLLPILNENAEADRPVSIPQLMYSYSMDSFANWQYGLANGCNLIQNEKERDTYLSGFFGREAYMFICTEMPSLVSFLKAIGINIIPKSVKSGITDIENWNIDQCDRAAESIKSNPHPDVKDNPLIFAQALKKMGQSGNLSEDKNSKFPNRLEIASEMFSFNSAAHETSGITLTYILYELSCRPHMQEELRRELSGVRKGFKFPRDSHSELARPKDVDAISFLDAIVMETLRLYPAVPGPQPRVTPSTCSLGGYDNIPPGVIVQSYAYTLHRNSEVFPDPEEWRPSRWLDASPAELTQMRKWFWAFGSGASMCIGSNFALLSIKMMTAAVYSNFTTSIYEHGDMEIGDAYLAGPRGDKLLLKFHHLESDA